MENRYNEIILNMECVKKKVKEKQMMHESWQWKGIEYIDIADRSRSAIPPHITMLHVLHSYVAIVSSQKCAKLLKLIEI